MLVVLGIFILAFGIDGINSASVLFFQKPLLYQPSNTLRLITGTGMGLAMAVALLPAFNQTVWQSYSHRTALETWGQFGGLLVASGITILLVLSEIPFFLYPLTLVSAGGVVLLLTMVYTMALLMLFRRENHIAGYRQLLFPAAGGFLMTLTQIIIIDLGRYILTGTWDGFQLILG
jgi:hypothetical protein